MAGFGAFKKKFKKNKKKLKKRVDFCRKAVII
jgi:hypothetical protein